MNVFVSHKLHERDIANRITRCLEADDINCTIVQEQGPDALVQKVLGAIQSADFLLVLLSPAFLESTWLQIEVFIALHKEMLENRLVVVPVAVIPCACPPYLERGVVADFCAPRNTDREYRKLLSFLRDPPQEGPWGISMNLQPPVRPLDGKITEKNNRPLNAAARDLYEAIRNGDIPKLKDLLAKGGRVDKAFLSGGSTPLHAAIEEGQQEILELLADTGADLNVRADNGGGMTPLQKTCVYRDLGSARILLEKGARVDATDKGGETTLHYAAGNADLGLTLLLLEYNASVDFRDELGRTPLHQTILHRQIDRGRSGWNEAEETASYIAIAALLLAHKADCFLTGGVIPQTAYELAAERDFLAKRSSYITKLLRAHVMQVASIHECAARCAWAEVVLFVSSGVSPNSPGPNKCKPLHVVGVNCQQDAFHRFFQTVRFLLEVGGSLRDRDGDRNTPPALMLKRSPYATHMALKGFHSGLTRRDRFRLMWTRYICAFGLGRFGFKGD